jgi:hypothetical protein
LNILYNGSLTLEFTPMYSCNLELIANVFFVFCFVCLFVFFQKQKKIYIKEGNGAEFWPKNHQMRALLFENNTIYFRIKILLFFVFYKYNFQHEHIKVSQKKGMSYFTKYVNVKCTFYKWMISEKKWMKMMLPIRAMLLNI